MTSRPKSPGDKSPSIKSPDDQSTKPRKTAAKTQRKTTVASEVTETVMREQAPPPPAAPKAPAPKPVMEKAKVAAAPPAPKPVLERAKVSLPPAPKPVMEKAKVAAPAPRPVARHEKATPAPAPQPVRKPAAASLAAMPKLQPQVMESAVKSFEQSLEAAGAGAVAVNRKLIDIARANVASGLDLAKDLAKAKSPMEFAQLQMSFWEGRIKALATQAEELRALSTELVVKANEPIREHVRRSLNGGAA